MMDALNKVPIIGALLPVLLGMATLWGAFNSVRKGKVRAIYSSVIAERANDPLMFWIYVAVMISVALVLFAIGLGVIR